MSANCHACKKAYIYIYTNSLHLIVHCMCDDEVGLRNATCGIVNFRMTFYNNMPVCCCAHHWRYYFFGHWKWQCTIYSNVCPLFISRVSYYMRNLKGMYSIHYGSQAREWGAQAGYAPHSPPLGYTTPKGSTTPYLNKLTFYLYNMQI